MYVDDLTVRNSGRKIFMSLVRQFVWLWGLFTVVQTKTSDEQELQSEAYLWYKRELE